MEIALIISVLINLGIAYVCFRMFQTYRWWEGRVNHLEQYVDTLREQLDEFYKDEMQQQLDQREISNESRNVGDAVEAILDGSITGN